MKQLIINSSAFILIFVIVQILIFIFFSSFHKFIPSQDYYSTEFNNAFKEKNFDLIALGNSKLLSSLDKNTLQDNLHVKTANLGCYTANISFSRLTLESYLKVQKKTLKFVLLEVSWFTFNNKRTALHAYSGDLLLEDPVLLKYTLRYSPVFLNNYKNSIIDHLYILKNPTTTDYSSRTKKKDPTIKTYTFDIRAFENLFPDHLAGVDELLLEDFYEIEALCKKNNIKLILYTAPEDREYSKSQKDSNKIKQIFNDVSRKEKNILYLDYSLGGAQYDEKFELWLNDSHHINNSNLFTNILVKDIRAGLQ